MLASASGNSELINKSRNPNKPLVIGIVAGEASGDSLGADFMAQVNDLIEEVVWIGVGGPKMKAQGLQSLFPLDRLAVMGLVEVMSQLPDLLKARSELVSAFTEVKIDWFIGIDAPDFNLRVAKKTQTKRYLLCSIRQSLNMGMA